MSSYSYANQLMMFLLIVCSLYYHFLTCAEEPDDFYEFTAEDYFRVLASKKEGNSEFIPISD